MIAYIISWILDWINIIRVEAISRTYKANKKTGIRDLLVNYFRFFFYIYKEKKQVMF